MEARLLIICIAKRLDTLQFFVDILSNREQRGRLANWRSVMGEVYDDELMNRAMVFDRVVSYMMRWGIPLSIPFTRFIGKEWPVATNAAILAR